MRDKNIFNIDQYEFSPAGLADMYHNHYAKNLWPVVYILSDGAKTAYIGESTDVCTRISKHLKDKQKSKLKIVYLISSKRFNKSSALDIESSLIRYISADGQFKLLNGNLGLANHNYYQKIAVYRGMFNDIWDDLRSRGVARHPLADVDNTDAFKYSPYKALSSEQQRGLEGILRCLLGKRVDRVVVEGGAGTGKTILAIFLFKVLTLEHSIFRESSRDSNFDTLQDLVDRVKKKLPAPKMGLVVPMSSFRGTLKKVFRNIKGLNAKMVIAPSEVAKNDYDLLIVDESHRLRRRVNLSHYGVFDKTCEKMGFDKYQCSELDWVLKKSTKTILFYDTSQSIKPSDVKKSDFDALKSIKSSRVETLKSQFRVRGGNAYVDFVDQLLSVNLKGKKSFFSKDYELVMYESLSAMVDKIKLRNAQYGLSRLIAGFAWPWVSKKDKTAFDIVTDGVKLRWNSEQVDWINSQNSVQEVGCIHTTQGYDLNYAGIIFGKEIAYDPVSQEIVVNAKSYFDKNGKNSIKDPEELKAFIINIYKTILLRGIRGTYVYICDPNLREYMSNYIASAKSGPDE